MDDGRGILINLLTMGRVYLLQERYGEAGPLLEEAVSLSESVGDRPLAAEAYASMGKYRHVTGNNKGARELLARAIEIDRAERTGRVGERLNVVGLVHLDEGRLGEAETAFREALRHNLANGGHLEVANSHRGIGDVLTAKGLYGDARGSFEDALESDKRAGNSRKIAMDLRRLGDLGLKRDDLRSALGYYIRAYRVDLNSGNSESAERDMGIIKSVYREMKDEDKERFYKDIASLTSGF